MLTLKRRAGESVMIGSDIEVRIASVRGREVLVNISAPTAVLIDRKEVRDGKVPRRRTRPTPETGGSDA